MNKEAPERCAAREEFSVEGVWGCCPIKQNGAPVRCSVFRFRGPESIACYNLFLVSLVLSPFEEPRVLKRGEKSNNVKTFFENSKKYLPFRAFLWYNDSNGLRSLT